MCAIDFEPVIATERLRLRKPRKADTARLAQHANDFDVARMTPACPIPTASNTLRASSPR